MRTKLLPQARLLVLLLVPLTTLQAAELKLAALFCDHMVLQRDKTIPMWGWAEPGQRIRVEFAGQKKSTMADAQGKWRVNLDPMPASAEPRTLVVQSEKPDHKLEAADVLVGEVWLGSGQSNMALAVARARDFEKEKAAAHLPLIRMFREESGAAETPQPDAKGKWLVCSPDTVGSFSATLFFFGRELHRALGVPVGLVHSSVGGTPIEFWIAREAQTRVPELQAALAAESEPGPGRDAVQAKANSEAASARGKPQAGQAKAEGKRTSKKSADQAKQRVRRGGLGGLFNGKIAPLIPYAIRGVVWYQGEANANTGKSTLYRYQLPLLVRDWRQRWGEELPFAWVQLPNYQREGDGWMLVREAMLETLRVPRTGMAITVDIGESSNIHPTNKQEVGRRLSLWALGEVYGRQGIVTSGPLPAGCELRGREMVVSFTHCDGGLQARGGELQGFVIAGQDHEWKPALAHIEGNTVVVSHPEIRKPSAVRYGWQADPVCNLCNGAGLPASPFRTDD